MDTTQKIKEFILEALKLGASDIHIHPEENKYILNFRIDGLMQNRGNYDIDQGLLIISSIKVMSRLDIAQKRMPQDGSFKLELEGKKIELRISTINTIKGEKLVMRIFPEDPSHKSFYQLGMTQEQIGIFERLLNVKTGMILVVGPTGSGKTTTLYAALNHLKDSTKNYVTIEDPVEYKLDGVTQINVDHKIGLDFPTALRSILRQDPDGILIGEIRDKETAEIAVRAALTGHLVLSTLHTEDCRSAILRLMDMGIENYLLAGALKGIVAQRLVRKSCACEQDCPCNGIGYSGRTGIFEILTIDDSLKLQMVEGNRLLSPKNSYLTLQEAGDVKVKEGLTDTIEIYRVLGGG